MEVEVTLNAQHITTQFNNWKPFEDLDISLFQVKFGTHSHSNFT